MIILREYYIVTSNNTVNQDRQKKSFLRIYVNYKIIDLQLSMILLQ